MPALFAEELQVVNVGLPAFGNAIRAAGGSAIDLEWQPPAEGDPAIGRKLAELVHEPRIEAANREAYDAYLAAQPVLQGIGPARDHVPGLGLRTILHSGPPIAWADMCGPMQGAIVGAILYEGWAADVGAAEALASSGRIEFAPCHHHGAVGPMAGVISPSMPVWVVANAEHGNRAYCNLNEGLGKVLRFGANGPEVILRLRWLADALAPALAEALEVLGGLELKPLIAQALHMGDEVHNRNVAASSLLLKRLAPALLRTRVPPAGIAAVVDFIAGNDHFFLNLSMAACKAMLDAAAGVQGSSLVTAMARNGVEFGIRLSGTGDRWFTAPAPVVEGLLFPGYTAEDAAPDLGDSAITETAGLGGFAMAAAPAIVQFVGGSPEDAIAQHAGDGPDHAGAERRVHPAGARLHRHARRDRCAQGGRYRDRAGDQHRHRAPGGGRRPDRRRHHPGAARVLCEGRGGARRPAAGERRWRRVTPLRSSRSEATP